MNSIALWSMRGGGVLLAINFKDVVILQTIKFVFIIGIDCNIFLTDYEYDPLIHHIVEHIKDCGYKADYK